MTSEATISETHLLKFQALLRELFQFDRTDLDFGIYRIMNHKRDAIEKFITEDLIGSISEELNSGFFRQQSQAADTLEDARSDVIAQLGADAINASGELSPAFESTPVGQKYLAAQSDANGGRSSAAVEASIYNHLCTFFSRYYQEGDFVSKRRYSRNQRYAIPYNGEEVYLYWANSDQYYVKTAEHFHNYDWTASNGVSVHFRLIAADVEQNNIRGDRRFFLPCVEETQWDASARTITVPFEYRRLTASEISDYGNRSQQDNIIAVSSDRFPQHLRTATEALAALTSVSRRINRDEPVSDLVHHLRQYTRRNDSDFFVHKDLFGFLSRELDFYLKNEVLNLDEVTAAGERMAESWLQLIRFIKSVGTQIIEFLAQIENFQKMLWEKRKFITKTQYCITLGSINSEFYEDIKGSEAQWAEWQELFGIDDTDRSPEFLQANPTLVLDTEHFDVPFNDRLLASFEDLDGLTDGLLIHGENWQALNLIQSSLSRRIQCLYIDPPYNTGDSEILYKNGYLRSSWLSLMESRLSLAVEMLSDDPTVFIAIDDFQMVDLCELVDRHFPSLRREMIVINHHPQGGKASTLSSTHEYMLTCVSRTSGRRLTGRMDKKDIERRPFKRSGTPESNFRYARPNSFYAILVDPGTNTVMGIEPPPSVDTENYPRSNTAEGYIRVYPLGADNEERVWRRAYRSCLSLLEDEKLVCSNNGVIYQLISAEDKTPALFSNWIHSRYNAGTFGANLLGDIIGERNAFPFPKSVHTVEDAIYATKMNRDEYCLDYFAGSGTTGHAVIDLNREDGGQRKFILVEMGQYFDTVLLPRIKKVTFTPEWRDGKPQREATTEEAARSPRIVKYMRLESYEDTLDGIDFDDAVGQFNLEDRIDGYLLKYMLKWETKRSRTLLNAEELTRPFDYRLRAHANGCTQESNADIAETFNYLLGLNVRTRRVYYDDGRRYLVYRGETCESPGSEVAVIWRETEGWDVGEYDCDRRFVSDSKLAAGADTVYINGASCIPNTKAVEPIFHSRMFAGATS